MFYTHKILPAFISFVCIVSHTSTIMGQESGSRALKGKPWKCHIIDDSSKGADGVKLADVNNDGLMDITTGWEEGGITRVYIHPGYSKAKQQWPAVTVGKTPSVEDAVFADLDRDNSMDVISCCEGSAKTVFIQWAPRNRNHYLRSDRWRQRPIPSSVGMMRWMFAWPMQVDGKKGVDIIAGGKGRNAQIGWFEVPENPRQLDAFRWHPLSEAGWIMSIWKSDMDGDGDLDIVFSDRKGKLRGCRWVENPGSGPRQYGMWKNHFVGARKKEVLSMVLSDLDKDGLQDIIAAVMPSHIIFFRRMSRDGSSWKEYIIHAKFNTGNARAVAVDDINKDGRQDIVLTTWNAKAKHGVIWLSYQNKATDQSWVPHQVSGDKRGIKYDRIELLDLDGDKDIDILTCEEQEKSRKGKGMGVFWYENPKTP